MAYDIGTGIALFLCFLVALAIAYDRGFSAGGLAEARARLQSSGRRNHTKQG